MIGSTTTIITIHSIICIHSILYIIHYNVGHKTIKNTHYIYNRKQRFRKMLLAEDLLHTVIKKVWLFSLNNDNIEEVPPIFSHHVFHAFVSEKI